MYKVIFIFCLLIFFNSVQGQPKQTKYALDSIHIHALTDKEWHKAYHLVRLRDSMAGTSTLPDLLLQKTAVFYKEYGRGMIAGISLRGTGTAHTQIVWNGIPVNSILNGQTDLNTFSPAGFSNIYIKKGGSSVSFGSGAIGGVVIFDDNLHFSPGFHLQNQSKIASFETMVNALQIENSSGKFYVKLKSQFQKSKNDYPYPGFKIKNENGAYQGIDYGLIAGYKIHKNMQWYFKSKIANWDRETSRTVYMPQNARLKTNNRYLLTGGQYKKSKFLNRFNAAWLYERYRYYFNKILPEHSNSHGQQWIIKNTSIWRLAGNNKILLGNEWQRQIGLGDHIQRHIRNNYALYAIWTKTNTHLLTRLKLRKDFSSAQVIPLTGAAEFEYKISDKHQFRGNFSRNFRLPTFNDLYWQPGGNPDLNPEESYAYEMGYDAVFASLSFHLTIFNIKSGNLIKWIPISNNFWQPVNFASVTSKGVEVSFSYKKSVSHTWHLAETIQFNYHKVSNDNTGKILPFMPKYVGNNLLSMHHKKWFFTYHFHYQGRIFTTTSNTKFLPAYQLHNLSLTFKTNRHWQVSFRIKNVLNAYYETIPSRPLPGRSYEFILNFKL